MTPRNLRKPTEKRCRFWWDEFVVAWANVGRWHWNVVTPDDDE